MDGLTCENQEETMVLAQIARDCSGKEMGSRWSVKEVMELRHARAIQSCLGISAQHVINLMSRADT